MTIETTSRARHIYQLATVARGDLQKEIVTKPVVIDGVPARDLDVDKTLANLERKRALWAAFAPVEAVVDASAVALLAASEVANKAVTSPSGHKLEAMSRVAGQAINGLHEAFQPSAPMRRLDALIAATKAAR